MRLPIKHPASAALRKIFGFPNGTSYVANNIANFWPIMYSLVQTLAILSPREKIRTLRQQFIMSRATATEVLRVTLVDSSTRYSSVWSRNKPQLSLEGYASQQQSQRHTTDLHFFAVSVVFPYNWDENYRILATRVWFFTHSMVLPPSPPGCHYHLEFSSHRHDFQAYTAF
ncbi:hypothetical protein ABKN59_005598 [Abortiporus biennis]